MSLNGSVDTVRTAGGYKPRPYVVLAPTKRPAYQLVRGAFGLLGRRFFAAYFSKTKIYAAKNWGLLGGGGAAFYQGNFGGRELVEGVHELVEGVERNLKRAFPKVEVLIHLDPEGHVDTDNPLVEADVTPHWFGKRV